MVWDYAFSELYNAYFWHFLNNGSSSQLLLTNIYAIIGILTQKTSLFDLIKIMKLNEKFCSTSVQGSKTNYIQYKIMYNIQQNT